MQLSRSEQLLAELGIVVMVGGLAAILNLISPDGTPLGARLFFALVGFVAAWIVVRLLAYVGTAAARLLGVGDLWGYILAVPLASALIAWAVLWLTGGPEAALGHDFARVWPQTAMVAAGFFMLFFVIYWRSHLKALRNKTNARERSSSEVLDPDTIGVPFSDLHDRLAPGFPPILALCAEDHYLRVIAKDRAELILLTLSEAIDLMPEGSGKRIHRSWWVARSAVIRHRRVGRDRQFELSGGIQVPISRAMVKPLRQAGWL
ncbi:MAG: LytTR family transcriptional regulator [Novosphingobium sp.]|uniref:LytTR family DNA-binding domain-containing protein n=1 Tax=Novosphingobium sp. TaxID=1874826 RepID=UPI0026023CB4|nr:LytTR family DNA-binding domain-containing protein [Novosphingobium sp.]MCP5387820.1 LytTR family transcriptional regulator [Novosphingobium sp.]